MNLPYPGGSGVCGFSSSESSPFRTVYGIGSRDLGRSANREIGDASHRQKEGNPGNPGQHPQSPVLGKRGQPELRIVMMASARFSAKTDFSSTGGPRGSFVYDGANGTLAPSSGSVVALRWPPEPARGVSEYRADIREAGNKTQGARRRQHAGPLPPEELAR